MVSRMVLRMGMWHQPEESVVGFFRRKALGKAAVLRCPSRATVELMGMAW